MEINPKKIIFLEKLKDNIFHLVLCLKRSENNGYKNEKKATSVLLKKEDMLKIKALSKKTIKSTSFLIKEAVTDYITRKIPERKIDIKGMVNSCDPYFAEKDGEILNKNISAF